MKALPLSPRSVILGSRDADDANCLPCICRWLAHVNLPCAFLHAALLNLQQTRLCGQAPRAAFVPVVATSQMRLVQIGLGEWGLSWATEIVPQVARATIVGCVFRDPDRVSDTRGRWPA